MSGLSAASSAFLNTQLSEFCLRPCRGAEKLFFLPVFQKIAMYFAMQLKGDAIVRLYQSLQIMEKKCSALTFHERMLFKARFIRKALNSRIVIEATFLEEQQKSAKHAQMRQLFWNFTIRGRWLVSTL